MNASRRYGIAVCAVTTGFVAINLRNFLRPVDCWDCFFPYGIPFTLYQKGGYVGGAGIVWKGLVADAAIVIVVSIVVGRIWQIVASKSPR